MCEGAFLPPLPAPSVSSLEKANPEPILNRVKVGKSSYSSKDLIITKRVVSYDRSTLFYWKGGRGWGVCNKNVLVLIFNTNLVAGRMSIQD